MTNLGQLNLAWLDANVYNKENKQLLERIREINSECREFIEEDECIRFLGRGIADPRRFIFIVSGRLGENVVPKLHEHANILSIYVYCQSKEWHKRWSEPYEKVKVVTTPEELISGVESDLASHENE